jgi:hypothetical protein
MSSVQEAIDTAHRTLDTQISALSDRDVSSGKGGGGKGITFPAAMDPMHQRTCSGGSSSIQHIRATTDDSSTTSSTAAYDDAKTSITYSAQTELPPLPVPSLEETLNKFLKSLEALHDFQEQRETAKRVVLEFLQGEGPQLQNLLLEYDQQGREKGWIGSYVEEFWTDAYLAPDASVVLVSVDISCRHVFVCIILRIVTAHYHVLCFDFPSMLL